MKKKLGHFKLGQFIISADDVEAKFTGRIAGFTTVQRKDSPYPQDMVIVELNTGQWTHGGRMFHSLIVVHPSNITHG